jgi:hypothetical protein
MLIFTHELFQLYVRSFIYRLLLPINEQVVDFYGTHTVQQVGAGLNSRAARKTHTQK